MLRNISLAIAGTMLLSGLAAAASPFPASEQDGFTIGAGLPARPYGTMGSMHAGAAAHLDESHMRAEGGPDIGAGLVDRPPGTRRGSGRDNVSRSHDTSPWPASSD